MAAGCKVVTYELEHVGPAVVAALDVQKRPIRPGPYPLKLTADRLAERRFVEANEGRVAAWREVEGPDAVLEAAADARLPGSAEADPRRLRRPRPGATRGPGGRSSRVDGRIGWPALLEKDLAFEAELSVVVARNVDGICRDLPARAEPARPRDPRRDRSSRRVSRVATERGRDESRRSASRPRWASSARSRSSCS